MHWKYQSLIYKIFDLLPDSLSDNPYYFLQRKFGGLKNFNHLISVSAGIECMRRFNSISKIKENFEILEIGPGRHMNTSLIFFLCGSKKIISVDNKNLRREEILREGIKFINDNIHLLLKESFVKENRIKDLQNFCSRKFNINDLENFINLKYLAPGDARNLDIPDSSIDCHFSTTVLEHIEKRQLAEILKEGKRILKDDGIFIHRVDLKDHFFYGDSSISPMNFYKFSEDQWRKYAGNKYAYTNRMRVNHFKKIFEKFSPDYLFLEPDIDLSLKEFVNSNEIHRDFKKIDESSLMTTGFWINIVFGNN